ncbi:MAG: outer membrane beta-barrel protein [Methylococcales bacterium]
MGASLKWFFLVNLLVLFSFNLMANERLLRSQDTVSERRKSELDPLGVHLYGFKLLPKFGWKTEYKDNIFKDENGRINDFITHIQPGFSLQSDWNRHAVNLAIDSDIAFYGQNNSEDYQDMNIRLNSRLDVLRGSALDSGFFFSRNHGDRGSPDDSAGLEPTVSTVKGFNLDYKHKFNRFSAKIGMIAQHVDYINKKTSLGTTINEQDRNNWHYVPSLRLGYEIQPQYEAFIEMRYSELIYDEQFDDNGLERSSHGYEGLMGIAFDATGLLTGDIAIGYKTRTIDDNTLSSISGMSGRLNLEWNPTPLMTVRSTVSHSIGETTQVGVAGIDNYAANIGVEHELLRSLLLRLNTSYFINQYNGFNKAIYSEDRKESGYIFGAGARYLMSRYVTIDVSYRFSKRNVNRDGADYELNQVFFNLIGHL